MALHAQSDLQNAIYDLLAADTTFMGLVTNRLYDHIPDNTDYPLTVLGEWRFDDWGSHTHDGWEINAMIHTFTQSRGKLTAQTIMNRIYTLLHNIDLSISGYPTVVCRQNSSHILLDNDGRTYNGVQEFRIILGGNPR